MGTIVPSTKGVLTTSPRSGAFSVYNKTMQLLQPSEYDISYFDGAKSSYTHNAGYTKYARWFRNDLGSVDNPQTSEGEFFSDIAKTLEGANALHSKQVLDIGCAKGYLVEDLRSYGVDAYGVDVSPYAIGEADPAIAPYLTVADIKTHLATYRRNEFDVVFSRWTLECFSDTELLDIIDEMNRISKFQIHIIWQDINPDFYNGKTITEWLAMPFDIGTVIIPTENMQQVHIKT